MYIRKIACVLSIAILLMGMWCYFEGAPWAKYKMEQDTLAFLQQQGVQKEDILELDVIYNRYSGKTTYQSIAKFQSVKDVPSSQQEWYFTYDVAGNLHRSF